MYGNNIVNFQEYTTILNAHTKKVWYLIECTTYIYTPGQKWLLEVLARKKVSKRELLNKA